MTMLLALIAVVVGATAGLLSRRRAGRMDPVGVDGERRPGWLGAGDLERDRGARVRSAAPPGAEARWRAPVLVAAGAVLVLVGQRGLGGHAGLAVQAAGYALLTAFALLNARRPGLVVLAVGLLANLAVMLANGGMPVRGQPAGVQLGDQHHGLSTRDHLSPLSDAIQLAPLGETVSPGDVLASIGGGVAVFFWLDPAAARTPRRGRKVAGRAPRRVIDLVNRL